METLVLEKYVKKAEEAFEQKDYIEGLEILQNALSIEPFYGKAHNHIGWVYLFQLNDWEKAEKHIRLALKNMPGYNAPYFHMCHILFEKGRFNELDELLKKAEKVGGVDKSFIHNEYGRINEVKCKFNQALKQYKLALKWAFDENVVNTVKDNMRRCRHKRWLLMF